VPNDAWSHALTIGDSEVMTLGFVFVDYLRHMSHHLRHIGVEIDDLANGVRTADGPLYPEKPAPVARPINDLMSRRWSPRAIEEGRPVEREKLLTMLEAARWAPSSFNDQPRFFLVFDGSDPLALEKARACLVPGNAWALKAPVLLLSVARETFEYNGKPNRHGQHDTGLATENLLLEAVEVGLVAHAMAGFDADRAILEFGIPVGHTPMAMIAVGYPYRGNVAALDEKVKKGEKALRERKPVDQMAFAGAWNKPY
jgi:nitroreductase